MMADEKFLVVDDHPVVLDGLIMLLEYLIPQGKFLTAADGASACAQLELHPDIDWIFLDIQLPDVDGIELLKLFELKKVTASTVILSSDSSPDIVDKALTQHASGFLSKSFNRDELRECLNVVEAGHIYLTPTLRRELTSYRKSVLVERQCVESMLSDKLRETLSLIAAGYSNREIAHSCNVAESTIKSRVKQLFSLFNADNRTHCVFEARRLDII